MHLDQFYYLATVDDTVKDDYGRSFPGNSAFDQGEQNVQCWGDNSVFVHIIDSCPAFQVSHPASEHPYKLLEGLLCPYGTS